MNKYKKVLLLTIFSTLFIILLTFIKCENRCNYEIFSFAEHNCETCCKLILKEANSFEFPKKAIFIAISPLISNYKYLAVIDIERPPRILLS